MALHVWETQLLQGSCHTEMFVGLSTHMLGITRLLSLFLFRDVVNILRFGTNASPQTAFKERDSPAPWACPGPCTWPRQLRSASCKRAWSGGPGPSGTAAANPSAMPATMHTVNRRPARLTMSHKRGPPQEWQQQAFQRCMRSTQTIKQCPSLLLNTSEASPVSIGSSSSCSKALHYDPLHARDIVWPTARDNTQRRPQALQRHLHSAHSHWLDSTKSYGHFAYLRDQVRALGLVWLQ